MGRAPAARGARRGGLPRRVVPRPQPRRRRRPGSAQPVATGADLPHPRRVLRGRRRPRDDEHVHRDDDRSGGLRTRRGGRRGDEPRRCAARARGRGRVGSQDRQPALRRRLGRTAQRLAVPVSQGRRPLVPQRDVRRGRGGLCAPDRRAAGGRGGPAPDRDGVRHAERKGRDRRRAGRSAGPPALALLHRRRQERAQPVRPDRRGVLDLARARRAARRRRQLLARSGRDASLRRGPGGARADLGRLLPERGTAERARSPRRAARGHEPLPQRVRPRRARQHRRRLLRDDARARPADRGRGRGRRAARGFARHVPRRASAASSRSSCAPIPTSR